MQHRSSAFEAAPRIQLLPPANARCLGKNARETLKGEFNGHDTFAKIRPVRGGQRPVRLSATGQKARGAGISLMRLLAVIDTGP